MVFIDAIARHEALCYRVDLSRWHASLGHRADVTIRVYYADNHMFFRGSGPSAPVEYEQAQHVDRESSGSRNP